MKTTPCTDTEIQSNPLYAFNLASRCGAKTRMGAPCKSPAVRFRLRCRMHGGARGSGAAKGNQNAFKHGYTTKKAIVQRRQANKLIKNCIEFMKYSEN